MTIFHVLPLAGLIFGGIYGAKFGGKLGSAGAVVGGILGAVIGFAIGRAPYFLVLRSIQREYSTKTVAELRGMLQDPAVLAPNMILLELGSRGENLERELSIVLDMLVDAARERRLRGWHALASAFPDRAKLIGDYRVDEAPEECRKKIQRLINARTGVAPNGGPATTQGES